MDSLFETVEKPAQKIYAADLKIGDDVDTIFVITRLTLREYDRGKFLSLRLSDKTGKISAVLWENAESTSRLIRDGDLVQVRGKVNSYQDELQISLKAIQPVMDAKGIDPADFLPISPVPLEKMTEEFDAFIDSIADPHLMQLLQSFRRTPSLWDRFAKAPGAKMWHHPYIHGLLEHSLNVVNICRCVGPYYPGVNVDLLATGAVFHDLGKINEFEYRYRIDYSTEGRLLGHIYIGSAIVEKLIQGLPDFPEEKRRQLLHIILSHHGEVERSPILPMTLEAALLHHIENMDAQMMAFIREMNKAREESQEWTGYVNLIQRPLYLGGNSSGVDVSTHPKSNAG